MSRRLKNEPFFALFAVHHIRDGGSRPLSPESQYFRIAAFFTQIAQFTGSPQLSLRYFHSASTHAAVHHSRCV